MNAILEPVLDLLPTYGPGLLFVLAILETSFVTGLLVPSGLATSAATALALQGRLELGSILTAAVLGGAVGDHLGFWIGRTWGRRLLAPERRWSRALAERRPTVDDLFGRHPLFSVTIARLISFVRTVMPVTAGMSGLPYRRYVPFELLGVVAWGLMYVAIGMLARESWEVATQVVGVGGTVAFSVAALVGWRVMRRRRAARGARTSALGTAVDDDAEMVGGS